MSLGSRLHNFFSSSPKDPEIRWDVNQITDPSILTPIRYSVKSRKAAWVAGGMAAFVATSAIFAGVYFQMNAAPASEYREVHITDATGQFDKLYLSVDKVLLGKERHPIKVVQPRFNILAHQGRAEALLLASGNVPEGTGASVRIVFNEAQGCIANRCVDIPLENRILKVSARQSAAVMVDLNVAQSLKPSANGVPSFEPAVQAVWTKPAESAHQDWSESQFEAVPLAPEADLDDDLPSSTPTDLPSDLPTSVPTLPSSPSIPTSPCVLGCADLNQSGLTSSPAASSSSSRSSSTPPPTASSSTSPNFSPSPSPTPSSSSKPPTSTSGFATR